MQIAPEGAVADAEAPEVEKAASTELMSVVTEETSAPLEDGTPTSPAGVSRRSEFVANLVLLFRTAQPVIFQKVLDPILALVSASEVRTLTY